MLLLLCNKCQCPNCDPGEGVSISWLIAVATVQTQGATARFGTAHRRAAWRRGTARSERHCERPSNLRNGFHLQRRIQRINAKEFYERSFECAFQPIFYNSLESPTMILLQSFPPFLATGKSLFSATIFSKEKHITFYSSTSNLTLLDPAIQTFICITQYN